ncbi:unnamed protein product [Oikopleura dioica]|uniref:Uncharacterized protein n=1 Tax=Oikopleura dioica TaxID=34765 RepID=E4X4I1_OIKDI|nr:unnamed protein product [Oikopleura dioica]CBY42769.1 unnamed protein product [Oikopleura dioica]
MIARRLAVPAMRQLSGGARAGLLRTPQVTPRVARELPQINLCNAVLACWLILASFPWEM